MIKKLEVLANVAVVITAILLCLILVKKNFFPNTGTDRSVQASPSNTPASRQKRSTIPAGTRISLPGIDWSKNNRTVLLALSTTCHFCTESAPFYQRLQQQKPIDVQIVAMFPQSLEDSRLYLSKLGISVSDVVQAPLGSVGVSGTPTMMLIDNAGIIKETWVGKVSETETDNIIARIAESK